MTDFDLRQIEYFVRAANAGSYARAARELFVTPQAISHSIQLLEARVDLKLFMRSPNGIELTEEGKALLDPAEEVLKGLERLQETADRLKAPDRPAISLGIHSLCFRENGGSIDRTGLLAYQKAHDGLALSFAEMSGKDILDSVLDERLDIGVSVPSLRNAAAFDHRPLKKFSVAALTSRRDAGHFAPSDDYVTLEELTRGELVLFTDEDGYNDFVIEQAGLEGRTLPTSSLSISPHGDMGFIAGTQLYVIRPLQHALRTVHDERLRILPIRNCNGTEIQMPLEILTRKGRALSPAELDLVALIAKWYQ